MSFKFSSIKVCNLCYLALSYRRFIVRPAVVYKGYDYCVTLNGPPHGSEGNRIIV